MTRSDWRLPPRRWRTAIRAGIVVFVAVGLFAAATARYIVWPDLRPLPTRADAIIELGGLGDRDGAALDLARQGRAQYG